MRTTLVFARAPVFVFVVLSAGCGSGRASVAGPGLDSTGSTAPETVAVETVAVETRGSGTQLETGPSEIATPDLCAACLARGGTWQPEADACTGSCDIQDISCFRDHCPAPAPADPCAACLARGGTWQPEADACTGSCDIQDISCFRDHCPTPAPVAPPAVACTSTADCPANLECQGPRGCDVQWTCGPPRRCTRDLVTYCGCDGQELHGSGTCAPGPYRARGHCP